MNRVLNAFYLTFPWKKKVLHDALVLIACVVCVCVWMANVRRETWKIGKCSIESCVYDALHRISLYREQKKKSTSANSTSKYYISYECVYITAFSEATQVLNLKTEMNHLRIIHTDAPSADIYFEFNLNIIQ